MLPGHPDRLADAVAERIVDEAVGLDPDALVGVEVAVHRESVFVTGRIAASRPRAASVLRPLISLDEIVRARSPRPGTRAVGARATGRARPRHRPARGRRARHPPVLRRPEHHRRARGGLRGDRIAAARRRTPPASSASALVAPAARDPERLGPDGKVLVASTRRTAPSAGSRVNVSIHHEPGAGDYESLYRLVWPVLEQLARNSTRPCPGSPPTSPTTSSSLNGAGDFSCGGTFGDNGLSGKKLVVDCYGPGVPIGGGALCGKDPHKVDRVGALAARQLAVRLVRDAHARSARVTLGWLPGAETPDTLHALVDGEQWDEPRIRAAIAVPDLSIEGTFRGSSSPASAG